MLLFNDGKIVRESWLLSGIQSDFYVQEKF